MPYKPRQVHYACRKEYPAYRWLHDLSEHANAVWKQFPDKMIREWGKERRWSIVATEEGVTIYGPDGDAVFWEAP